MAALFGINRLRELAGAIPTASIEGHLNIVRRWHDDYHNGSLKNDNETSREQAYNHDVFIDILGYVEKPAKVFTFEPKASTDVGQIPDARIGSFDYLTGMNDTVAVVELKGARVALDRPQRGHGNLSPVQQGFKYRPLYRGCLFVIVSNFWEIRLYNDNQLDYESWTLDDLVDSDDDYLRFKTFYLLLKAENLLRVDGKSKTQEWLSDIRITQDRIGRDFYEKYSTARHALLSSMWLLNPDIQDKPDFLIEKAQKVIDRVVFACFAEDRGLLPDNTLHRIAADSSRSPLSTWTTLRAFFDGIDRGDIRLGIPVGYNGGLFARDDELDVLAIGDAALLKVIALGDYNFEEDLSVNILGHIFEQSISDLEGLRGTVVPGADPATVRISRRRNQGIYYTPEYVVRYIVDRTLGARLREIEARLLEKHLLHGDIQEDTYRRREVAAYIEYRNELEAIRVVDPACGSGAFLVQAFDFLIAEHRRVASILDDIYNSAQFVAMVLQNNLYGVDLNEESVEITKLSLWLKTASKGNKLTTLDGNIKSGNSVKVSDLPGNGPRFNWSEEFTAIFEEGGFDVVVGNPPYIREAINRSAFDGLRDNPVFQGKMDIWTMFANLAIDIAKENQGRIGFIAPSNWVTNAGASKFRHRLVRDARIEDYVDFGDRMIFEDASIQTMIFTLRRTSENETYSFPFSRLLDKTADKEDVVRFLNGETGALFERFQSKLRKEQVINSTLNFNPESIDDLLEDIKRVGTIRLERDEVATGIDVHQDFLSSEGARVLEGVARQGDGIFVLSDNEYRALDLNEAEKELLRPYYTTDELHRYYGVAVNRHWVIYTNSNHRTTESMAGLPHIKTHLDRFAPVITSGNAPYGLHRARAPQFFQGEHIVSLRKCVRPTFTYVDFDAYVSQTFFVIKSARWNMKALTAILNSTLVAFWLRRQGKMQGGQYQVDKAPLMDIPLLIPGDQSELADQADVVISARRELAGARDRMLNSLNFDSRKWMDEQEDWWHRTDAELASTMPRQMAPLRKSELLALLEANREAVVNWADIIEQAETSIDQLVFELYGLSQEQVEVIRSATRAADLID